MKNISEYSFERLVINHGNNSIFQKLFNKNESEINSIAENNLATIYSMINDSYNNLTEDDFNKIMLELREQEKIDDEQELISEIKSFQENKELIEVSADRFVEMLEYCKIKVPKSCYSTLECIRSDKTVRMRTSRSKTFDTVFNALYKLLDYKLLIADERIKL